MTELYRSSVRSSASFPVPRSALPFPDGNNKRKHPQSRLFSHREWGTECTRYPHNSSAHQYGSDAPARFQSGWSCCASSYKAGLRYRQTGIFSDILHLQTESRSLLWSGTCSYLLPRYRKSTKNQNIRHPHHWFLKFLPG